MIIKVGQEVNGLRDYHRRNGVVKAKRMNEDFMVESSRGWEQGRKGDWLVIIGGIIWTVVGHDDFQKVYFPAKASPSI